MVSRNTSSNFNRVQWGKDRRTHSIQNHQSNLLCHQVPLLHHFHCCSGLHLHCYDFLCTSVEPTLCQGLAVFFAMQSQVKWHWFVDKSSQFFPHSASWQHFFLASPVEMFGHLQHLRGKLSIYHSIVHFLLVFSLPRKYFHSVISFIQLGKENNGILYPRKLPGSEASSNTSWKIILYHVKWAIEKLHIGIWNFFVALADYCVEILENHSKISPTLIKQIVLFKRLQTLNIKESKFMNVPLQKQMQLNLLFKLIQIISIQIFNKIPLLGILIFFTCISMVFENQLSLINKCYNFQKKQTLNINLSCQSLGEWKYISHSETVFSIAMHPNYIRLLSASFHENIPICQEWSPETSTSMRTYSNSFNSNKLTHVNEVKYSNGLLWCKMKL
ncbi:hypothetical protein VP01_4817g1 [Puccinia sorghi]|uniref:Uncharacterized protein n=1 Tax=Puccinia sorghi TaxID=27349 RepID=A0A0L6UMI4_9BASI|nr:hypothetical protein VP01_4817g1 [Puccinia sorghi]